MLAPMVAEADGHLYVSDSLDEAMRSLAAHARRGAGGHAPWNTGVLAEQGS